MPVSAWAIGALQRAAGNRAVCERLDDSARRARPVQRNYTHAAVSTFGVELAASGEFAGASLDHYNEITKSLRKKVSKSTKERAVRLAMLEEKIRSAWQRLRNTQLAVSDQARTEGTGPPRVLGVFTAPEWFFKRPYQPFDSADKHVITGHIAALSAELPHLLIVPGSILWAEGAGDDLALRNTTVAFLDGRLLRELDKHANLQDTDSYFRSKDPKTRKLPDRDTIDAAYGAVVLARRDLTGGGCFSCPEVLPPVVVSRDATGVEVTGGAPSLSADGRFVAFSSSFEGTPQVYRHDTDAAGDRTFAPGPTVLVSALPAPVPPPDAPVPPPDAPVPPPLLPLQAGAPSLSGAGDRVAFTAVPDPVTPAQVYLADLTAGRTVLVSAVPAAPTAGAGASSAPALTPDGATVAFASLAPDLLEPPPATAPAAGPVPPKPAPAEPAPAAQRVYARYLPDLGGGGLTELLSGNATDAATPAVDAHGREVVFHTAAPLAAGDANVAPDTYRHRRLPSAALAPATLDFGPQPVGIAAVPRELTLSNIGPGPLLVTEVVPTGPFTISGACPVVQRGQSCALAVAFVPTVAEPATGTGTARGPNGELVAQLAGRGTIPALLFSPPTAPLGQATLVRAAGLPAGVPVTLTWRPGLGRVTVTTDAAGAFTASMPVLPNDIAGPRVLVATFPGGSVNSGPFPVTSGPAGPPF